MLCLNAVLRRVLKEVDNLGKPKVSLTAYIDALRAVEKHVQISLDEALDALATQQGEDAP